MSKVLITDDAAVLREFVKASLANVGHDVQTVSTEVVKSRDGFDVVLDEIGRPFSLTKLEHRLRLMGL